MAFNLKMLNNFNPRSRTGSDVFVLLNRYGNVNFNPRSRTGSDSFA